MNVKRKLIIPTDEEDAAINASIASDPDTFEATSDQFRAAKHGRGIQKEATKVPVSIRLDQDVVDFFRHSGRGWQTKVNEILREYKATH
jgi:uncharacterized protein (DUF4415 family)